MKELKRMAGRGSLPGKVVFVIMKKNRRKGGNEVEA